MHILSTCYVSGPVLGTEYITELRTNKTPCAMALSALVGCVCVWSFEERFFFFYRLICYRFISKEASLHFFRSLQDMQLLIASIYWRSCRLFKAVLRFFGELNHYHTKFSFSYWTGGNSSRLKEVLYICFMSIFNVFFQSSW